MSLIKEKEKIDFLHYIKIIVNLHITSDMGNQHGQKTRARTIFSSAITFCKFLL